MVSALSRESEGEAKSKKCCTCLWHSCKIRIGVAGAGAARDTFAMLFFLLAMSNIGAASQVRRGGQPSKKGDVYVQMATNPTAVSLNLIHARRPRRFPSRWWAVKTCQEGRADPPTIMAKGFRLGGSW